MATTAFLELFRVSAAPWPETESLVARLAVLAGFGGAWPQAAHRPPNAQEHDPALVTLLVV